jgi:cytochrome c553
MPKLLILFALIFSLVITPAMAQECCPPFKSAQAEQGKKQDSEKGNFTKAAHCCGCHQLANRHDPAPVLLAPMLIALPVPMHTQHFGASITTGPLLEPPSHA